tara:strand:+ start:584 stop:1468 length:885 start_codon:yes stop_codon:yes gene_type:complete
MSDFVLTPKREKELEKIAKDLPDKSFKDLYGKDWKSIKIATAMNILKKKYGFKTEETKMKFKEIREKIRSKMSGSKLTGAEVSVYYRKNPGAKKASRDPKVKKAIEFALDHGGAMTFAIKNIEKMKRGLASHPEVAKALEFANFGEAVVKETLEEGTWRIPKTKKELKQLVDLLAKPYPATTPKDVDKFQEKLANLMGDDKLYDDLESVYYEKGTGAGELKRPLVKMNKFPKVFLNVIAGESLARRIDNWIDGKVQGNKYIATHHFFDDLMSEMDERAPARKHGKIKKGKKVKI